MQDFWDNLSTNERIVAVVIGLLFLVGMVEGQSGFLVLLLILGALYAFRQREETEQTARYQREARDYVAREVAPREKAQATAEKKVHRHAVDAVRRAGLDPDALQVLPVDIGLLSFHGDGNPVIHRKYPVDDDVDYIQPFVQLRVPVTAAGRVKFEVIDDMGQRVFVHEDNYQLERGRNLIIPAARLPIHDEQEMNGGWRVQISADGVLLARHLFEWRETDEGTADSPFREHLAEDGEIGSELRAVLADSRLDQMSLDDLLAHQDEEEAQQRGGAS